LPNILEEIAKEDEDKQNKHLRRVIAKQEVLKIRPPRLGKYKYETKSFFTSIHFCYIFKLTSVLILINYICSSENWIFGILTVVCFRFEAPPVQVLLTEEMTGSLRKLKV